MVNRNSILATFPLLFTLVLTPFPSAASSPMLPSEQFFFHYLDDWISLINNTLETITPVDEHSVIEPNSISNRCYGHMTYLLEAGRERKPWALKIFDSMGKPGSGIMEASLSFLGFYSECIEAKAPSRTDLNSTRNETGSQKESFETQTGKSGEGSVNQSEKMLNSLNSEPVFGGRYCLANLQLPNSAIKALQKLTGLSPSVLTSAHPRIGLCLPSTCSANEIQFLANTVLSKLIVNSSLTVSTCTEPPKKFSSDIPAILVVSFFCLALLPVFVGTLYDCIQDSIRPRCNSSDSKEVFLTSSRLRTGTINSIECQMPCHQRQRLQSIRQQLQNIQHVELNEGMKCKYLLAFSIKRNVAKIFDTSDSADSIDIFHGLRFFMMLWIIGGHSYSFAMQWLFFRNPKDLQAAPSNALSQILANGTFSVDTFLFLSGFLVTRVVLNQMKKSGGKFDIVIYYLHRYLRMTPLMMVVIAFCATLLKYMSEGPSWQESIVMYDSWCRSNGWLNALYLHNFINRENMCLSHTWYSAVDMQLYFVAPIILIPLYKRPKLGLTLIAVILSTSVMFTCLYTIIHSLPAVPYMSDITSQESLNQYYGVIYIKPYTRLGPYLVGMTLGFILFKLNGKFTLSRKQAWIGWTVSTILSLATLFAMMPANNGHRPSDLLAGLYSSCSRVIWALSLSWVTFACCAGRGGFLSKILSSKLWVPCSRLTYSAYIVHPVVMAVFYGSRQTSFEFSHSLMLYLSLGNLVVTYFISLVLSVVFESPIVALEKLVLSGLSNRSSPKHCSLSTSSSLSTHSSSMPSSSSRMVKRTIDVRNNNLNENNNHSCEVNKNHVPQL